MNLLLLDSNELSTDGRATLRDLRAKHLRGVLGAEPGKTFRAGVIGHGPTGGVTGTAEVLAVGRGEVEIRFHPEGEEERAPGVHLVLALPRPKALRRILRLVATMGVERVDLVNAWRVEKAFFDSPALEAEAVRKELILGAEQGGTTRLPAVEVHRLLMPYLERWEGAGGEGTRLLAHPSAEEPIETAMETAPPVLAIGPEGGWIEKELASLRGLGFRPVTLGPWTLTTEAAVAVALGQVEVVVRTG